MALMSMWMVRAGRHDENEELAPREGVADIGWNEFRDLRGVESSDQVKAIPTEARSSWRGE